MERRAMLKLTGLAGIVASGMAPALVKAQENLRWRLASSFPKNLDTIYGGGEVFAQKVRELSDGKFTISVHAGGELMPAMGVVDALEQNSVEAAHTAPYYFFGKNEAFALSCAIPFGMNSRQLTAWMYHGNGLKLTRDFYANYNIVNFPCGNSGVQMGGWFRKQINTPDDIRGLKIRIGGLPGKVIEKLGGIPQNIAGGEVYQALEKGVIDAAEWVGPYDDLRLGFHKVAPYYYYPGWWEGSVGLDLLVNKKAYEGLSQHYKDIVAAASTYAHLDMQAKYDARNPGALKELVGQGAKVLPFSKEVLDASFKASEQLYAELSESNPQWRTIYADYRAFQKDELLWFRFAEARFDQYMQSVNL
ncbi:TRAP transporter substrate-binding protein DctP [Alcaligenes ammonioxydans]|uniref:ABC transporter substrate-binding protein n=1 Tax=Alcaligenes ammonioxydans TaxID=2582914 RepID=A0ABX8SQA4_9BURK|nr:TRAP transporter substrate-binding protein DctP [Alcaligenes ammonioxydans]MCH1879971.1 TRAP transporter substrate-binding protein DctP [Alcaligenes ammonioxydans]QXX77555.1 ABC transporter substrate-binding protein [Alcaligenes ammonioxydans]WGQ35605.1 TRAP transporter substrate-binding protein DctP [Alcaligenes faecalis]HRK84473.1 TRAP transporter substrate-binding protein DctP [Alcaligenes faecalis]